MIPGWILGLIIGVILLAVTAPIWTAGEPQQESSESELPEEVAPEPVAEEPESAQRDIEYFHHKLNPDPAFNHDDLG